MSVDWSFCVLLLYWHTVQHHMNQASFYMSYLRGWACGRGRWGGGTSTQIVLSTLQSSSMNTAICFSWHSFLSEASRDTALRWGCGVGRPLISYLMRHTDGCSHCLSVCLISFIHGWQVMSVLLWNGASLHSGLDVLPANELWACWNTNVSPGKHATT